MSVEKFIRQNEAGLWECNICGFTAMSKKVIKQHIKNAHIEVLQQGEEQRKEKRKDTRKKDKEKKEKRTPKPWNSFEFEELIGKEIVVILRNGTVVTGKLKYETAYNLAMTNATLKGPKHIAKVEYLVINKSNVSHLHTTPIELKPKEESE